MSFQATIHYCQLKSRFKTREYFSLVFLETRNEANRIKENKAQTPPQTT